MVREHFAREFLKKAVEEFGSEVHLARALGTTRAQLHAWMEGREELPSEMYQAIVDLLRKPPA